MFQRTGSDDLPMNGLVQSMGQLALLTAALAAEPTMVAPKAAPAPCRSWLRETVVRVEKRPETTWRMAILSAFVQQHCLTLPAPLRRALQAVRQGHATTV